MSEQEQHLLQLCKRLLATNEELYARIDGLYDTLRWLCTEYRALREQSEREKQNHAVETEAFNAVLGGAIDLRGDDPPKVEV
ncbi:MAG: hypothetical protein WB709_09805 [Solirubrobacteraceae bacterium]